MSKQNVSPAARGAADVRPKRARKHARRDAKPEDAPEPAAEVPPAPPLPPSPTETLMTPPRVYERAFKRLKADVLFSNVNLSNEEEFDRIEACKGFDYLAGELVARAVDGECLDAWEFVDHLHALVAYLAQEHADETEREQALLLLEAVAAAQRRILDAPETEGPALEALEALVESVDTSEKWPESELTSLCLEVAYALQYAATGWKTRRRVRPTSNLSKQLDCITRRLMRGARAVGGFDRMLLVLSRLQEQMRRAAGGARTQAAKSIGKDMLRWAVEQDAKEARQ